MQNSTIEPHFLPGHSGYRLLSEIRKEPLGFFTRLGTQCGSYAWLSLMGSKVLFLNDATAIKHVFRGDPEIYHKGKYNDGVRPLLGKGVFLAEESLWWRQRREIAPAFAGGQFEGFTRDMSAAADEMMSRWQTKADKGEPIDISYEMLCFALDVVFRALYHQSSSATAEEISVSLGTMLRLAESRIWSLLPVPMGLALKLPKYKKTLRALDKAVEELVECRRRDGQYPEDLLSRLLSLYTKPEEKYLLRDNVMSFLLGGHETTANGMAWAFYELGRNPDVRRKIAEEADRVIGQESLNYTHIKNLTYTHQVLNEVLRLYPPIWTMSRQTTKEDIVPLDDGRSLRLPKDTTVMLCSYSVHRREKYWDDPEAFNPDRFARNAVKQPIDFSYFPFGGGPRLCMGLKFAELESILVLAKALQRFDIRLIPGQSIQQEPIITLRPDRPVMVRLYRKGAQAGTAQAATAVEPAATIAGAPSRCPFHRAAERKGAA